MNEEQIRCICETFNTDPDHKFYVYALCERKGDCVIPFYIGKGEGMRVWEHEIETDSECNRLHNEYPSEDPESIKAALTRKQQRISEIGAENIEKIIIKWGLTSYEAFMAESALINLLRYEHISFQSDTLVNVVNGHASDVEQAQSQTSCARNIDTFYRDCVEPPIDWGELSYDKIQRKAIFRNINQYYPRYCENASEPIRSKAIRESARGCWPVRATNIPQYLFAMYRDKIVGIYEITGIHSVFEANDTDFPQVPGNDEAEEGFNLNKDIGNYLNEHDLSGDKKNSFDRLPKPLQLRFKALHNGGSNKFRKWCDRKYYSVKDAPNKMLDEYLNHSIRESTESGTKSIINEHGFRYNFQQSFTLCPNDL